MLAESRTVQTTHTTQWKRNWSYQSLENMGNSNGSSPFVSEKCVNLGVSPQLILNNGHVHQLGEVQFALGLPAVEPGPQQGRPFQLQHLLTAALIWLQGEQSQILLLFISFILQRTKVSLCVLYSKWLEMVFKTAPLQLVKSPSRFTLPTRSLYRCFCCSIFSTLRVNGKRCPTERVRTYTKQCNEEGSQV